MSAKSESVFETSQVKQPESNPPCSTNLESQEISLVDACIDMRKALTIFRELTNRTEIISISAAIEGARLKEKNPAFQIVAEEMQHQSGRNLELSKKIELAIERLQTVALRATAVRYYELAEDLIDKIDRNLFERNCDCQAWATFETIVQCTQMSVGLEASSICEKFESDPKFKSASDLLEKLMTTYEVYSDIFLLNQSGVVINAAKNRECIGESWRRESWFREAIQGKVHVSEMQFCEATDGYSVFYSAPVVGESGAVIGVLSTRFNWSFAQEMIASAGFDRDVHAYFLNAKGEVVGATDEVGTLNSAMHWLDAGRSAMKGHCGYSTEQSQNGYKIAVGFARTRGYNSYRGKKWSALLTKRLGDQDLSFSCVEVDHRSEEAPLGERYLSKDRPIESEAANEILLSTMTEIVQFIEQVIVNNREVTLLAVNASIQAGRAGAEGDSFSIIAQDIGRLANNSLDFVESVQKATKALNSSVRSTVASRLKDAARDAADKVDRNLFERFCDVQAWTTFDQFISCIQSQNPSDETNALLEKLHKIYEVYHDILLLDRHGNILASAINRHLIGQNQSSRDWFCEAIEGRVHFTDVYFSESIRKPTVAFSAPILNSQGEVIGVLSTRFNCNFLNDILAAVIAPVQAKVYLINDQGDIIAPNSEQGPQSFSHLQAFQALNTSSSGTLSEKDSKDKIEYSIGFARAQGYNAYPGKNWSVVIRLPITSPEPSK